MFKRKIGILLISLTLIIGLTSMVGAEEDSKYFVNADMVRGGKNATGPVCVLNSNYKLGEQVVFRADIYDAETGERITEEQAEELGLTVTAVVHEVDEFEMSLGLHPKEEPQVKFWVGVWNIPSVFQTGWFKWTIEIEDEEGNKYVHEPIGSRRPQMSGSWIYIEKRE